MCCLKITNHSTNYDNGFNSLISSLKKPNMQNRGKEEEGKQIQVLVLDISQLFYFIWLDKVNHPDSILQYNFIPNS